MTTLDEQVIDLTALMHEVGPEFDARAAEHDSNDSFVEENYETLKANKVFSALIPKEFGGGGFSHGEMCYMLHALAGYCSSTALCVSMHQHLIATMIWKYKQTGIGQETLEKIATNELVLVSTGARDWLESNGTVEKVEGGYLVSAKKAFASGCMAGNLLVTSAPYDDHEDGPQVIHFAVPMDQPEVQVGSDWEVMGMRGTGSHTVTLDKVYVPEACISLCRPQGTFHPFWSAVLTNALPLITSVYVGISDRAAAEAVHEANKRDFDDVTALMLGELENERVQGQMAMESMIALANNYDFKPDNQLASDILVRKTLGVHSARRCVSKAMEILGSMSYRRGHLLERLFRDVQAGEFHPLAKRKQHHFTGRVAMGLTPVE